ncbi:MAG: sulfatase-like hydrolase/transferase, partial [Bacteroidales bacterium]|nr:sulfatase-like hydrolase/transferase [Bacteroidales bacterium]
WGPFDVPDSDFGDTQITDWAIEKLKQAHDKPMFLCVGYYRPHIPLWAPKRFFDRFTDSPGQLPQVKADDLDDLRATAKRWAVEAVTAGRHATVVKHKQWHAALEAYLACVSYVDYEIGRLLHALDHSPLAGNTLVVLWSDHGWHLGSKDHWHKQTLWEECTRIPFIMDVPDLRRGGSKCNKPIDMVNVFPTLVSLCGLPALDGLDGHDMTSLLRDPGGDWPWPAMSEIKTGHMAVRSQNWRYIRYRDGSEELYESSIDPYEWDNLANEPEYGEILEEHRKWVPPVFAQSVLGKEAYFFDPYAYTWINKEDKRYVDGKE